MKIKPKQFESYLKKIVKTALAEDIGAGDITAELIPENKKIAAHIILREDATICGTYFATEVFHQLDQKIKVDWLVSDGETARADEIICFIDGPARSILSGERTALNFLQTLSAVATKTRQFVDKIAHTQTQILDTRKTIPGIRLAEKYAVACGGGKNHRLGLFDAFLIKENHIAAMNGSIEKAISAARKMHPEKQVEIEVRNLTELKRAIAAKADIILLDNFTPKNVAQAVKITAGKAKLEASGGINLDNIASFAETGVNFTSIGALTKDIKAVDLSMLFEH